MTGDLEEFADEFSDCLSGRRRELDPIKLLNCSAHTHTGKRCTRRAAVETDGQGYCLQHIPPTVARGEP